MLSKELCVAVHWYSLLVHLAMLHCTYSATASHTAQDLPAVEDITVPVHMLLQKCIPVHNVCKHICTGRGQNKV